MVDNVVMRIGQIAELAGTTTRTVRYYHRIGLLAEPARLPNGYRDYGMSDAIRLMRIRWLAESGVPLDAITGVLADTDPSPDMRPVVADLRALVASLDEQHAVLVRRRARLADMLDDAERGRSLTPLPARLAGLLDTVIASVSTPATKAALQRERELVEGLVLSGRTPDGFVTGFTELLEDDTSRERYLDLLARWADLEGREPDTVADEITSITAGITELMAPVYGGVEFAGDGDADTAADTDGGPLLDDVVPDPAQHAVVERIYGRLRTGHTTKDGPK